MTTRNDWVAAACDSAAANVRGHRSGGSNICREVAVALIMVATAALARAEVQVERLFLPDAAPSSFAIGLPGGVSFCFDPVRCAVSYVWTGGFLDLTAARPGPGKFVGAAKLLGPVVYRESGVAPLRRGDPARVPDVEFAGYTLHDDAVEFRYTVDGVLVREEVRARADGRGLTRRFNVTGAADAQWWYAAEGKPPQQLAPAGTSELRLEIRLAPEAKS